MADDHAGHGHGPLTEEQRTVGARAERAVRGLLVALIVPLALITVVGLIVLRPHTTRTAPASLGPPAATAKATVDRVGLAPCPDSQGGSGQACTVAAIHLTSGPDEGRHVDLAMAVGTGANLPTLHGGSRIVVQRLDLGGQLTYQLVDLQRGRPLLLLAVIFAVLVVLLARWKGVAALVGLAITLAVLLEFVLPAIIEGRNPVAVAVVGSSAVLFAVFYLGFGVNVRSSTALAGTVLSLLVTGLLAIVFVGATHLTGASSDDALTVAAVAGQVNLRGLLLAGTIFGALGVLNDVTITQSSAVWQLHLADPGATARQLYRRGMEVGRDHIGATVDTLVLAYAGASLPLLVLFTLNDQQAGSVVTSAVVAEEVVRTLVGAIGLVLSVPITTALAAALSSRAAVAPAVVVRRPGRRRPRDPFAEDRLGS